MYVAKLTDLQGWGAPPDTIISRSPESLNNHNNTTPTSEFIMQRSGLKSLGRLASEVFHD